MNWIWLLTAVMLGVWMFTRRSFSRYVLYPFIGCINAFAMSLVPVHALIQLGVFALTTFFTFVVLQWPKKEVKEQPHPAQPLFGQPGYVTRAIPAKGTGEVKVLNTVWKASDLHKQGIPLNEMIRVKDAKDDVLVVEMLNQPEKKKKGLWKKS